MAESIYLQLPRDAGLAHWLLVDSLGNRIGHVQQGSLADAAGQAQGRRLTAFVPGEDVMLFLADIPSRNLQKVQQAAPFLLEDKLVEDVDTLHFAASLRDSGGHLVAVTRQERMHKWLDEIDKAGLQATHLVAETSALAVPAEAVTVVLDGQYVLTRFPDGSGFSVERDAAADLLRRKFANGSGSPVRAVIYAAESDDTSGFAAALDGTVEVSYQVLKDGVLPLLAAGLREQRGLNLLQAVFQQRSDLQEHWRVWRMAVILAVACLILLLVQQGMGYMHLRHQAADLGDQVNQVLNQAMPGSKISPGTEEVRMKQLLAQLQGGSSAGSLLPLLDALGASIAVNPSIQIIAVNYQGGSLQAQLQAGDIGALDGLKNALNGKSGITANLDSVNASGSQVTGRITLSGGGS